MLRGLGELVRDPKVLVIVKIVLELVNLGVDIQRRSQRLLPDLEVRGLGQKPRQNSPHLVHVIVPGPPFGVVLVVGIEAHVGDR